MPLGLSDALVFINNLRSPLTTTHPHRPPLRRPIKISAPILHESLHFNVNATAMNSPAQPESPGIFYLVSNKSGTGKTIVHRPRPPSQSSPQQGNFDALPGDPSTVLGRRISRPRKRPVLAIRTASPPPPTDRKLDSSSVDSRYLWLDPVRSTWNSLRRRNRNPDPKGKQRAEVLPEEDEQGEEQGRRKDERRHDTYKTHDIRAWMMGKPSNDVQRSATYPHRQSEARTSPTRNHHNRARRATTERSDVFRSRTGPSSVGKQGKGPLPGQTYDMVNRQIIEKNPDKTVELSTWKEHSEKAMSPGDAERISVYYVTAGELELGHLDKEDIQLEWRYDGPGSNAATDTPQRVPSSVTASKRVTADEIFVSRRQSDGVDIEVTFRGHGTISPSTSEKDESSGTDHKKAASKPKDTSTTLPLPPPPPPRDKGPYSQSTPIEKELPPFPFHATRSRSGSTISSIKSESTLHLTAVLESCEPSLAHILPTLERLGIRRVDHLRAVAKLTPATRDREIREDALRMGITVMEWAIFVDKIFAM